MSESGARRLIEPQLWTGEELLWCDQPIAAGPVASAAARKGFFGAMGVAVGVVVFFAFVRGAFMNVDPQTDTTLLIVSGVAAVAVLAFGTISAWSRARRLAHLVAYGVSNRRIIMVQGDDTQWVGGKELESVRVEGSNVVVTRGRTQTEHLWASQGENRAPIQKAETVARELTLAALPNAEQVAGVIQTLLNRSAS
jgi:hypothetical protein